MTLRPNVSLLNFFAFLLTASDDNCTNFCLQLHNFFTTAQSVHNCTLKTPVTEGRFEGLVYHQDYDY